MPTSPSSSRSSLSSFPARSPNLRPRSASLLQALALVIPTVAALGVVLPSNADAACWNGDPVDCNPPGTTLNPAAAFIDPAPPPGYVQCAGFINTDLDDVTWDWENNCIPFNTGDMWLRVYNDLDGSLIAGAHLFDPIDCPFAPGDLGYNTDMAEGAGFLGHAGACTALEATAFGWHLADDSYCSCGAPDGMGNRTCNDIFTANAANSAVFWAARATT